MSKTKQYLIPIAIIIAGIIVAGAVYTANSPGTNTPEKAEEPNAEPQAADQDPREKNKPDLEITEDEHIRGPENAPVTIVEYSDFECPYCKSFHPTVKKALEEYPEQVRWVYRHFPLERSHPEARPAAEASECAAEQDEFWEFADALFENQDQLEDGFYSQTAQDLNLDVDQFENCIDSRKYKEKVENDFQSGQDLGVTGTPGSFVNGEALNGAVPYEKLKAEIENALSDTN